MRFDEAYLFDAVWIFFAGWSVVLLTLTVIAFGRELIPVRFREQ